MSSHKLQPQTKSNSRLTNSGVRLSEISRSKSDGQTSMRKETHETVFIFLPQSMAGVEERTIQNTLWLKYSLSCDLNTRITSTLKCFDIYNRGSPHELNQCWLLLHEITYCSRFCYTSYIIKGIQSWLLKRRTSHYRIMWTWQFGCNLWRATYGLVIKWPAYPSGLRHVITGSFPL